MKNKGSFRSRIIALALITSLGLFFSSCKRESLENPLISSVRSASPAEGIDSKVLTLNGITTDSYYLENALPAGYAKDGSKDYTSYVQAAVTKYNNIVFPAFPILVNDTGISIGSNKTITFLPGSQIRLKGTSSSNYNILKISGVSNVTLYNPVIIGDRNSHIGTDGEAGMGIGIRGSSNVSIYGANVTECWGDGIYIGQTSSTINCKNIVIQDAYLRKNRRDGISIIAADGLLLENIYAGYSDGTLPMSGINFEPNNPECVFKNVRVINPRTEFNGANGIQIGVKNMVGSTDLTTDFTIINHVDIGSPRYSFKMMCNPPVGTLGKMNGLINIVNPAWHKAGTDIPLYLSTNQVNFKTTISSPEVINSAGKMLSYADTYTLLMKQSSRASLIVTNESLSVPLEPVVLFAVNAGGPSFKAANGVTYGADRNYTKGSIYKTASSIGNTTDDVLYQTERYGNFSYSIPLADGTYEITFKASETYHKASGKRLFSVLAENTELITNLDLYSVSGFSNAFDLVKTVKVSDGTLNLDFRTSIDNAKISAFHIIQK